MGICFIGIILFVLGILLMVLNFNDAIGEWGLDCGIASIIIGFTMGAVTLGMSLSVSDIEKPFVKEYNIACESLKLYDDNTNFMLIDKLYNDCIDIDKTIETNKRLCDSRWRGKCYSHKIAEAVLLMPMFEEKFINNRQE